MNQASGRIVKTYVSLTLLSTFASSFIWGINTLFLLDAGLTITEAFTANAFFTAGQVIFEVPTGIVADTRGRRTSFLLGTATLFATTLAYLWLWQIKGPFWMWAIVSALLGLGFTFFSGATEAWLVDGIRAAGYKGELDPVFAKGSIANGIAMLTGTIAGGVVAQYTNLGVPYIMRIVALGLTFGIAFFLMHDEGFTAKKKTSFFEEVKDVVGESVEFGLRSAPIRWMMLSGFFNGGVGIFGFYAMQPYLLQLYGETGGYAIAGISAAIVAGAMIVGGLLVPFAGRIFRKRTTLLIVNVVVSALALFLIGIAGNFWLVLILLAAWSIAFASTTPIRQSYVNGIVPSAQRATVLSADNLLGSAGGVVSQPALGKIAEVWGYPASYIGSAVVQILALPFLVLAKSEKAKSDVIHGDEAIPAAQASA
ncbi:MAG TPA: MFS transporter [Pyrinomonadaceae bacterium]|nr:MFS transporter [Pyrinomonadaceae bacterium]